MVERELEKVVIAEIVKKGKILQLNFVDEETADLFQLYGFLKCYLKCLESDLIERFNGDEE